MFNKGLSLDQAPPIDVILRFFLTMPFFGLLAGISMLFAGSETVALWDAPQTVSTVHLALLGIAGMAMVGALFQMLPVVAGAPIRAARYHARWIHAFMGLGTLMLSGAFYFALPAMLHPALALLLGSLGFVAFLIFSKLLKVENKTASVKGMMAAIAGLGIGLLFALLTTLAFFGVDAGFDIADLRSIHLHFMLFGWIATLIMAVAFQVIEMFYVTPPYPKALRDWLPVSILGLLVLQIPVTAALPAYTGWIDGVVALLLLSFAVMTLMLLAKRKRPIADATVKLWRTGLTSLIASVLFYLIYTFTSDAHVFAMAGILFAVFALSIIFAMSYKIVPFLVWFHLNAKGVMETPMMGDVIPAKRAMAHLWIHWGLIACTLASVYWPMAWKIAGALLAILSIYYAYNLAGAAKIYYKLKDKGIL